MFFLALNERKIKMLKVQVYDTNKVQGSDVFWAKG